MFPYRCTLFLIPFTMEFQHSVDGIRLNDSANDSTGL